MTNENETQYHRDGGHKFPLLLKVAWTGLILWMLGYTATYVWPLFKEVIGK